MLLLFPGQIAQSVEQRTENPCVVGSIPSLANYTQVSSKFGIWVLDLFLSSLWNFERALQKNSC